MQLRDYAREISGLPQLQQDSAISAFLRAVLKAQPSRDASACCCSHLPTQFVPAEEVSKVVSDLITAGNKLSQEYASLLRERGALGGTSSGKKAKLSRRKQKNQWNKEQQGGAGSSSIQKKANGGKQADSEKQKKEKEEREAEESVRTLTCELLVILQSLRMILSRAIETGRSEVRNTHTLSSSLLSLCAAKLSRASFSLTFLSLSLSITLTLTLSPLSFSLFLHSSSSLRANAFMRTHLLVFRVAVSHSYSL